MYVNCDRLTTNCCPSQQISQRSPVASSAGTVRTAPSIKTFWRHLKTHLHSSYSAISYLLLSARTIRTSVSQDALHMLLRYLLSYLFVYGGNVTKCWQNNLAQFFGEGWHGADGSSNVLFLNYNCRLLSFQSDGYVVLSTAKIFFIAKWLT